MTEEQETPEWLRISQSVPSESKELNFSCPQCGGDVLSRGEKNYLKVNVCEDGELSFYGGDNLVEDQSDFACYECGLIICQGQEPIRTAEDMIAWLKANCEQEDSQI
jgi:predicted RNA-binding Zn-ribbon protein involved in translation (DUF1610 family)